ncbi:hypothetical protein MNBD_GAMMA12-849 [hydrothermal vent metagenome]|uniref:Uncharacterized protein n=1 Tax=hydrothermal vent metagenome TaxID=652676 RepID=A0A3B0YIB0_9ZZZZ
MNNGLVTNAKKILNGKGGRLEDEELEFLAQEITKLGFKLDFARAYAVGPRMIERLVSEVERQGKKLERIEAVLSGK